MPALVIISKDLLAVTLKHNEIDFFWKSNISDYLHGEQRIIYFLSSCCYRTGVFIYWGRFGTEWTCLANNLWDFIFMTSCPWPRWVVQPFMLFTYFCSSKLYSLKHQRLTITNFVRRSPTPNPRPKS